MDLEDCHETIRRMHFDIYSAELGRRILKF